MGALELEGWARMGAAGPSRCGSGSKTDMPLMLSERQKPHGRVVHVPEGRLTSANTYAPLTGLGPTSTVTRCDTLILRATSPIDLRVTQVNYLGGADVVFEERVVGLCIREWPSDGQVKLVEARGVADVEYLLAGPQ